jgi:hypothetical protein
MSVKPTVKIVEDLHICFALTFISQKVNRAKIYWNVCAHCCDYVQCSALSVGFECVVILPQTSCIILYSLESITLY